MYMVFCLGRMQVAVESRVVRALIVADFPATVRGERPHARGAILVQGRRVPVVDLRAAFGLEGETPEGAAVLVIDSSGRNDGLAGLLVDEVLDVVAIRPEDLRPTRAAGAATGYITGLAEANERVVALLDVDRILALAP